MTAAEWVFWACFLLSVYTYFLYPVVLFAAYGLVQVKRDLAYLAGRRNRRVGAPGAEALPAVSILVPAHNEERYLKDKLANLAALDYPREKMEVVFVSDGSTDGTNAILAAAGEPYIRTVFLDERRGKANALNVAAAAARHEILVFSDASTLFDAGAVQKLVRHFADPRVGVACGSLRFVYNAEGSQTEGKYWQYESMLRLMEARLGATLTASGANYAMRREAFRPLDPHTVLDDFVLPMNARRLGYRVVYDPEAAATEFGAASVAGEFTRRVRLAMGSFRALPSLVRTPMRGFTGLAFVSHKLLRWLLPFLLIGMMGSSVFLLERLPYRLFFLAAAAFCGWAALGALFRRRVEAVPYALVGYFVVAMNAAFLVGFFRALRGQGEGGWQRVH